MSETLEVDPLYDRAVAIIQAGGIPTCSRLQRELRIGWGRAFNLLQAMETAGIVSLELKKWRVLEGAKPPAPRAPKDCTCPRSQWVGSEPNDSTCELTEEEHESLAQAEAKKGEAPTSLCAVSTTGRHVYPSRVCAFCGAETASPLASESEHKPILYSVPDGELDEFFIDSASVHVERMDDACFWMGLGRGKSLVSVRTGVEDGKWFFRVEDEGADKSFFIERPVVDAERLTVRSRNLELEEEGERNVERRKHTQNWYGSHYGKLEDWARKVLPEPWKTQFFSCIANGSYDCALDTGEPYVCKAGMTIVPTNYFRMDTAEGQLIRDQTSRAEAAEAQVVVVQAALDELKRATERVTSDTSTPEEVRLDK